MAIKICACCGQKIDTIKNGYSKVMDNFLQVKFFDDPEGKDNIFCSDSCVLEALSVEHIYDEEEDKLSKYVFRLMYNGVYKIIDILAHSREEAESELKNIIDTAKEYHIISMSEKEIEEE